MKNLDRDQLLPLTSREYSVLLALSRQPMHGYGIARQAELDADRQIKVGTSTLYATLARLVDNGYIKAAGTEPAARSANERQLYRLTSMGRQIFEWETDRLHQAIGLARDRLSA